jgi:hypothetical protein
LFGLSARFSVPACEIDTAPRTVAVKTGRKATVRREAVLTAARTARASIRLGAPSPYGGRAEAILECNNRSSAGYCPATFTLDSLVGSLAARPIAPIGPATEKPSSGVPRDFQARLHQLVEALIPRGTKSSNPASSTGESGTNRRDFAVGHALQDAAVTSRSAPSRGGWRRMSIWNPRRCRAPIEG